MLTLKQLIESGKLGPVRSGMSRRDLRAALGPPDDHGATSRRSPEPSIYVYQGVEFHFDPDDQLCLIHSEDLDCARTHFDRWIFCSDLSSARLRAELDVIGVRYTEVDDPHNPNHRLLESEGGARLLFALTEGAEDRLVSWSVVMT